MTTTTNRAQLLEIYAQQAAYYRDRYLKGQIRKEFFERFGMVIFNNLADEGDRIIAREKME